MLSLSTNAEERQLTFGSENNHELDNNDNFSPDDRFLVFDTRDGNLAESKMIGKVEIATGKITELYRPADPNQYGPGVLAASFSHQKNEVAFIHGPLHPNSPENQYEKHRRMGGLVSADGQGELRFADARDITSPFTPGALRGGTHRHEFSGDGNWLGFTYNDEVMRDYGIKTGKELDLRTIGVTKLGQTVSVAPTPQFLTTGEGFSVLVVVVTPEPKPGSDEISHAAQDSWVGLHGYKNKNGQQQRARAFIGTVRDQAGNSVDELFIVDIPEEITIPGPLGPLEGTETTFPMPPDGTVQRRLTTTVNDQYPGCEGNARSSVDGSQIAFRKRDKQGDWQIFLLSPLGGTPKQATFIEGGVTSDARWNPNGESIACVAGTKLLLTNVKPGPEFGKSTLLNERPESPFALVWSHDGKTLAYNRRVKTEGQIRTHIFVWDFE